MSDLARRRFLAGAAATTAMAGAPAVHAKKAGSTLRFVPHADLRSLDPIAMAAYVTRNHGYMIYDTLFGTDEKLQIRPQMVGRFSTEDRGLKWSFTLRDGLKWHDGTRVTAEDAVESLRRWGRRDPLGKLLFAHAAKIAPVDAKTFALELGQPFGLVLEALGKPSSHVPFIMPARVAAAPDGEPINETIGSGPFRFVRDEWQPGHRVVYVRNREYVPRKEAPSGSTGGKHVRVDRVIWRHVPDQARAVAALEAGEIDWLESPSMDIAARLEASRAITVAIQDPHGTQGWIRPNHLHPPFDNKKARQALLHLVDQQKYLQAAVGRPKYYRTCPAIFTCGGPWESGAGAEALAKPDLARARRLVKASGYDGRPVVVLDPTDYPIAHGAALVTRELMTEAGFTVDLQAMDWSAVAARRARKEPPGQGGWNVLFTWWIAADIVNPAVHVGISGAGGGAWFGWPDHGRMEALRLQWARTMDRERQRALADEIQRLALDEVMYVPFGQWMSPTAYRRAVKGVLQFPAPLFWGVSVA
ncbi:MAG: ABC transporter substrate-binding protein [Candidatus Rokuibacteriota bacterium]